MYIRLLLLSLVLIILGQTPLVQPIRSAAAKVVNPLQYGAYHLSQNLLREFDFISNLHRLRSENINLSEKVLELESEIATRRELEEENRLLKEQLGAAADIADQKLILAQIIGRSARGGEATLTINKGSKHNVREGAAVVFKNLLLGEVFLVEPGRARVRLLTDHHFSVAALDQDSPDRARGLVVGQYGTMVVLKKVLPTESLVTGDTIISSGEDGKFNKGLILGRVKRILGEEAEVFKGAELELMIDFDSLEEVFVIK